MQNNIDRENEEKGRKRRVGCGKNENEKEQLVSEEEDVLYTCI